MVYRAGDAASGWAKSLLDLLGHGAWLPALVGSGCAALWAWLGFYLGRRADQAAQADEAERR